ncbi:MAG: ribonuclease III domain-containing protein [Benniella sp.]|nr:MAG: ribonuclease III domain-containing protein [Benniella sp.]
MASNNGCCRIDIMGSSILPSSTTCPDFHRRETCVSMLKVPASRPNNIPTQGQIFEATAGRPKMTKSIGTAFVKMAFGLSAFVRLPAGTAGDLTTDRQRGYINLRRKTRMYTFGHDLHEQVDAAEWARVSGVESVLGYPFKDRSLLVVALRPKDPAHASSVRTNDSLEYLGDSVLELVAALFWLLEGRPVIGNIAKRSVTNQALQAVCLRWGLDRQLIGPRATHCSKSLNLEPITRLLQGNPTQPYWEQTPCCKTLADAVEAIFGAVFLDC